MNISIQGILNVTPDSFSDGNHNSIDQAVQYAMTMIEAGANIIDIGGESTRPDYTPVPLQEELKRVIPVIEALALRKQLNHISIDSYKASVMKQALKAGATLINDVNALHGEGALRVALNNDCQIIIMDGFSLESQAQQQAGLCLVERLSFRFNALVKAGIAPERLIIDPGIGFNKTLQDNIDCIRLIPQLKQIAPVLIGGSKKSMLGLITNKPVKERLSASLALALKAVDLGASIIRVHDVSETVDAIKVWQRLND